MTVTATADNGYTFTNWTGDLSGGINPATLTMDSNKSIIANFSTTGTAVGQSDYFSSTTLASFWSFVPGQAGDPVPIVDGNTVQISALDSAEHDLWTTGVDVPRLMQSIPDEDFLVAVKYDSLLDEAYQMQGVIIEAADGSFLRLEFYGTLAETSLFAVHIDGSTVTPHGGWGTPIGVAGTAPMHLQIERVGDAWTVSYSLDGVNWTTPGGFGFNLPIAVNAIGIYGGNVSDGSNPIPAHTATIDHFLYNIDSQPVATHTAVTATVGNGSVSVNPSKPVYNAGESVTLTASPASGQTFVGWSGDANGTANPLQLTVNSDIAVTATFTTSVASQHSDEFNAGSLDAKWTWTAGLAGDQAPVLTGSNLKITVPSGPDHDIWTTGNESSRIMQTATDEDFELEVKFDSGVGLGYQTQGILFEASDGLLLRIEFLSAGSGTNVFMATIDGSTATPIGGWGRTIWGNFTSPLYYRVNRQGDQWTVYYSDDGSNWQTRPEYSFTVAMTLSEFGIYAGNAGFFNDAPVHTMSADYFRYSSLAP